MPDRQRLDVAAQSTPMETPYDPAPFRVARWLRHPHAQTIGGRLLRKRHRVPLERERIETPDGDFVDLDCAPEPRPDEDGVPVVLLLHGLEGSARGGYAHLTYGELAARGMRGVGLNFRSCSGEPNRLPRFYHSGETDDLRFVLDWLADRFRGRPLAAVGFSLGGNALLKYLGEEGAAARLKAAVAVSVPYDLDAGERHLDKDPVSRFYVRHFLDRLRAKARQKEADLIGLCDVQAIARARSFREFDDAATAPLHGFTDAADYYARSSSLHFLAAIRRPTLLIHARDDPFLPAGALPRQAVAHSRWLDAAWTEKGGHVGFIAGPPWRPEFWAESEAARYLSLRLSVR